MVTDGEGGRERKRARAKVDEQARVRALALKGAQRWWKMSKGVNLDMVGSGGQG